MEKDTKGLLFQLEGKPSLNETMPMAFQHVVAMIVGCITPALLVGGVAGANLSQDNLVLLIQMSLVIAGLSTLVQLFPIGKKIGSSLPVILGVSFAYVPTMQSVASTYSKNPAFGSEKAIGVIVGAMIVGGACALLFGMFVKYLKPLFPPLVTGTVVFTIGLSLYPIAIRYIGGGNAMAKDFANPKNLFVGFLTLAIVTALNHFGKGFIKLSSILISIIIGYLVSIPLGLVNFSKIASSSIIINQNPILHFAPQFETSVIISFVILFIVNSVQAIGDFTATTVGGLDREPTEKELSGGIIAYGITNMLGSLIGGLPTATFSQNVGIVGTTKVVNRRVFAQAAIIILIAGLIPKFGALLTTIPTPVLGGATIPVFSSITMTGIKLIAKEPLSFRNTSIIGLSVAIGMGVTAVPQLFNVEVYGPTALMVKTAIGSSPVVLATLCAIILNVIIPKKAEDIAK
ncbi:uracil permease [Treponema phagedenis]|uniref:Purine permease n=1 Tax=Treponema phagedenis TaxID=162 RepID=A0A0B7GWW9_TREPH|nr:solute carrier family 23 protein [Treponema phagedenis]NVP24783.1 purine/pyrimidine permease [Treponema phagedenis]QEJ95893.1 purine permease [Treponema phagedenis]QEJ98897.1 purine permease [Treponema phagedenis]QEK00409.1 purine permease [Treponema phagedenis]QEK04405.1 purine permease [Treponema phagedenis]